MHAALAERERKVITERTIAVLAAAKATGQALGNPKLAEVRAIANANHIAGADAFADAVAPAIRGARAAGAKSLRDIANALNGRGIAAARGGKWEAMTVANVPKRLGWRRSLAARGRPLHSRSAGCRRRRAAGRRQERSRRTLYKGYRALPMLDAGCAALARAAARRNADSINSKASVALHLSNRAGHIFDPLSGLKIAPTNIEESSSKFKPKDHLRPAQGSPVSFYGHRVDKSVKNRCLDDGSPNNVNRCDQLRCQLIGSFHRMSESSGRAANRRAVLCSHESNQVLAREPPRMLIVVVEEETIKARFRLCYQSA
jgi:hypothetical protein